MNWLDRTNIRLIDVLSVDVQDAAYLIPSWAPLDALLRSIQAVGILNPPVVQERRDGTLIPVLGRRRLAAARHLGLTSTPACIAPPDMPEKHGFELAFWDNIAKRNFDPAVSAFVVRRILELFPRWEAAGRFLPALGIKPEGPRLERLRAIGGLESRLLEALATGRIQEKTAVLMTQLLPHERLMLFDLAERLRLNSNKTAEVASHLVDLAVFTHVPLGELLADPRMSAIVNDEERPASNRAADLRALIREWKFPELVQREREFRRRISEAGVPRQVSVRPTSNFEDERCTVEIAVESWDELDMIVRAMHRTDKDS